MNLKSYPNFVTVITTYYEFGSNLRVSPDVSVDPDPPVERKEIVHVNYSWCCMKMKKKILKKIHFRFYT